MKIDKEELFSKLNYGNVNLLKLQLQHIINAHYMVVDFTCDENYCLKWIDIFSNTFKNFVSKDWLLRNIFVPINKNSDLNIYKENIKILTKLNEKNFNN